MTPPLTTPPIRSIQVKTEDIGYVRWCLESHEGIAVATTRAGYPDILDLTIAPDLLTDAESFISAMESEIGAIRVPSPPCSPLG